MYMDMSVQVVRRGAEQGPRPVPTDDEFVAVPTEEPPDLSSVMVVVHRKPASAGGLLADSAGAALLLETGIVLCISHLDALSTPLATADSVYRGPVPLLGVSVLDLCALHRF